MGAVLLNLGFSIKYTTIEGDIAVSSLFSVSGELNVDAAYIEEIEVALI